MLDQNTDRMWFVIGAVIVGAAIVFIANGTMPELFASVSDTFHGASEDAIDVIDDIAVASSYDGGINLLSTTTTQNGYIERETGRYVNDTLYDINESTGYIDVSEMDYVTISFYDRITQSIPEQVGGVVWGYDADRNPVQNLLTDIRWTEPTSETIDVSGVHYIRANLLDQDVLRYKIEEGTEATPYA